MTDAEYMDLALHHAEEAFARGDWPVAAVIVRDGAVLATGQNRQNTESDVTWHAEFEAIRTATRTHGAERVAGATVYTTMEPCPMCAGALLNVKVGHWVLGGRFKAVGRRYGDYSVETFLKFVDANIEVTTGILPDECQALRNRYYARR